MVQRGFMKRIRVVFYCLFFFAVASFSLHHAWDAIVNDWCWTLPKQSAFVGDGACNGNADRFIHFFIFHIVFIN